MRAMYYEILKILRQRSVQLAIVLIVVLNTSSTVYSLYRKDKSGIATADLVRAAKEIQGMSLEAAAVHYESKINEYLKRVQSGEAVTEDSYLSYHADLIEYERMIQLLSYDNAVEDILENLYNIRNSGIFGTTDSYPQKLANVLMDDYERLRVKIVESDMPYGADIVVNNAFSWLLSVVGTIALCIVISRYDFENHTALLLFTKKKAYKKMALAKIGSICFIVTLLDLLIYLDNLLIGIRIGMGDLSRPVQSLTGFYESALPVSVGEYIILYFFVHLLADLLLALAGLCVFYCFFSIAAGGAVLAIFFAAELLLFYKTNHMWLKYINILSFLDKVRIMV